MGTTRNRRFLPAAIAEGVGRWKRQNIEVVWTYADTISGLIGRNCGAGSVARNSVWSRGCIEGVRAVGDGEGDARAGVKIGAKKI